MRKQIALLLAMVFAVLLTGCVENAMLEDTRVYTVETQVHSVEISVGAADVTIQAADAFSVESNLKHLTVSEENGVLSIVEDGTKGMVYNNPVLTVCIPETAMLETISITTGAAKLTADSLSAQVLKLQLGAGDVRIGELNAQTYANISGGAGRITVSGGTIHNLELEMGMGALELTAALRGKNALTLGVGESNITLVGSADDYRLGIEKGLGKITVNGVELEEYHNAGNEENRVQIEGGIGTLKVAFREMEEQ